MSFHFHSNVYSKWFFVSVVLFLSISQPHSNQKRVVFKYKCTYIRIVCANPVRCCHQNRKMVDWRIRCEYWWSFEMRIYCGIAYGTRFLYDANVFNVSLRVCVCVSVCVCVCGTWSRRFFSVIEIARLRNATCNRFTSLIHTYTLNDYITASLCVYANLLWISHGWYRELGTNMFVYDGRCACVRLWAHMSAISCNFAEKWVDWILKQRHHAIHKTIILTEPTIFWMELNILTSSHWIRCNFKALT